MNAEQMQFLGIFLIIMGLVSLGVTQFFLVRAREKELRDM